MFMIQRDLVHIEHVKYITLGMWSTPHCLTENTHYIVRFLPFLFRNLSACGSYEICNLLVEQDVMTPLAALLQEVWNILQNPLSVVFVCPKYGVEFC
jgi:hypothetical protein